MLVVLPNDEFNTEHKRAHCGEVFKKFDSIYKELEAPKSHLYATPTFGRGPEITAVPVMLNTEAAQKATTRMSELRQHEGQLAQVKSRITESLKSNGPQRSSTWAP